MTSRTLANLEDNTAALIAATDKRQKGHILGGIGVDILDDIAASSLPVGLKLTWVLAALNTPQTIRGEAVQRARAVLDSVEHLVSPREPSRFQFFAELKMDVLTTFEQFFPKRLSPDSEAPITSAALAYFDRLAAHPSVRERPGLLNTAAKACFFHVVTTRQNEGGIDKVTLARGLDYAERGAALFADGLEGGQNNFITNQQHFWMACLYAIGGNPNAARKIVRAYFDGQSNAGRSSHQFRWLQLAHVLTPPRYLNAEHDRQFNFARDIDAFDSRTLAELRRQDAPLPAHLQLISDVLARSEGRAAPQRTIASVAPGDRVIHTGELLPGGRAVHTVRTLRARPTDQNYG